MKSFTRLYRGEALKGLLLLVSLLCGSAAVLAQNSIYVKPVTFTNYEVQNVEICLDNSDVIGGGQFDLVMPDELVVAGEVSNASYWNTERLTKKHTVSYNSANRRVIITSAPATNFVGNEGWIIKVPMRVAAGRLANKAVTVGLANVKMIDPTKPSQVVEVSTPDCRMELMASTYTFSALQPKLLVKAGQTARLDVSVANTGPMAGMQMDIVLPQGMSIDGDNIDIAQRLNANVAAFANNGFTRLVVSSMSSLDILAGTDGRVFSLPVVVSPEYADADGVIEVKNIFVSVDGGLQSSAVSGFGFSLPSFNVTTLLTSANATVAGLRESLAAALTYIDTNAPKVAARYRGEAIAAAIDALAEAVDAAYADNSIIEGYDAIVTAKADAITADIAALKESAVADQNRVTGNEGAHAAVKAQIAELQSRHDSLVQELTAKNAPHNIEAEKAASQAAITKAGEEADADLNVHHALEGVFCYTVPADSINGLIDAMQTSFDRQEAELQRQSANLAAHTANVAVLDSLQASLDSVKAKVAADYAGFNVDGEIAAAQSAIAAARTAANEAFAAVAAEGVYNYTLDTDAIEALIAAIEPAAKAQADAAAEAARVAANQQAHAVQLARIEKTQTKFDMMQTSIMVAYPMLDMSEHFNAVQVMIDNAVAAANEALEAVAAEGNYSYVYDDTEIVKAINQLPALAQQLGVSDINIDVIDSNCEYFDLNGRRVKNPAPGQILIKLDSQGLRSKIIAK